MDDCEHCGADEIGIDLLDLASFHRLDELPTDEKPSRNLDVALECLGIEGVFKRHGVWLQIWS